MRDLFKDYDLFDQHENGMKVGLKKMKESQKDYQTMLTSTNERINSLKKDLMNAFNLSKRWSKRGIIYKNTRSLLICTLRTKAHNIRLRWMVLRSNWKRLEYNDSF